MKSKPQDILWIVPNLNEKIEVIEKNLKLIKKFCELYHLSYTISIYDGGSEIKDFLLLQKTLKNYPEANLHLVLPPFRPTKNKAILDAVNTYYSKCVAIVDADCFNLNLNSLKNLVLPVLFKNFDASLPFVTKSGGRINRLICRPLLRLLFPKISKKIYFPLTGMIALKFSLIKNIVNTPRYPWDWGGEIYIILGLEDSKVNQYLFNKTDAKKRSLLSKKEDALQIMRTLLFEALKRKKIISSGYKRSPTKKTDKSYEEFLLEMIVRDTSNIIFQKKRKKVELKNVPSSEIDLLQLKKIEKEAGEIYSTEILPELLNKKELFLERYSRHLSKFKSSKKIKSILVQNLKRKDIEALLKIYNQSNLSFSQKILKMKKFLR